MKRVCRPAYVTVIVWCALLAAPAGSTDQTPPRRDTTPRGWQAVASPQCHIVVRVPRGWTVQPVKWDFGSDADCGIGLRPPDWLARRARSENDVSEFAVYIGVSAGTLDNSCDKMIVCRDADGWYFEGRAGTHSDGHAIRTPMGPGVRGEVETGVYARNDGGGYTGAGTALIAVVNRARQLAQFIGDHEFDDTKVFDGIVQGFEFQ